MLDMGKRLSDEDRAVLSRLLEDEDDDEDQADEDAADEDEDEEPDEFVHRGKRYRHVPDEEPAPAPAKKAPAKKAPAKKAPAKKAAPPAADPEPEPVRRRRFVS